MNDTTRHPCWSIGSSSSCFLFLLVLHGFIQSDSDMTCIDSSVRFSWVLCTTIPRHTELALQR
ncbi:hypothetical protein BJY01DRAFT_228086 [Aspergillus pseudoustus]|uniref:Uncharacterized protein n=1 Tax=Aspergillus pseudoustus TaxID=1810923 RepID=A0ABR4IMV4_9EURO